MSKSVDTVKKRIQKLEDESEEIIQDTAKRKKRRKKEKQRNGKHEMLKVLKRKK